jgi:hypothetical protein
MLWVTRRRPRSKPRFHIGDTHVSIADPVGVRQELRCALQPPGGHDHEACRMANIRRLANIPGSHGGRAHPVALLRVRRASMEVEDFQFCKFCNEPSSPRLAPSSRASQSDCASCPLKTRCCPNTPMRKIARSIHESAREVARDVAKTDGYKQSRKDRKKVEMLFAHLKRILSWIACVSEGRAARRMSSCSQPPRKTYDEWRSA